MDYRVDEIESLAQTLGPNGQRSEIESRRLADLEMLCTNAFLLYGPHLLVGGLDPKTITPSWTLNRRESDLSGVLEEAVRTESIEQALNRFRPHKQEYDALVQALARYRRIANQGGCPTLAEGPTFKQGAEGARERSASASGRPETSQPWTQRLRPSH